MRKALFIIFFVLSIFTAAGLSCGLVSMYSSVEVIHGIYLLAFLFPWIYIVNLCIVPGWFCIGHPVWSCINILFALVALPAALASFSIKTHTVSPSTGHTLSIMTYNTHCLDWNISPSNPLFDYLCAVEPDIICLQEFEVRKAGHFLTLQSAKQRLALYPYTYFDFSVYHHNRQYGLAVFSKYPLLHKTSLSYDSKANLSNYCDVVVRDDTFRIFNNHLESNRLDKEELPSESVSEQWIVRLGHLERQLHQASVLRAKQAKVVRQSIMASPYPVIVCGDFNDIPVSFTYHHIRSGQADSISPACDAVRGDLRDAYIDANPCCLGNTYQNHYVPIRIDYTLYSKPLKVVSSTIDTVGFSDHFPLLTTFTW